jgi:hypothetical protein
MFQVIPLLHGWHFDDLQKDCLKNCPPVVVAFHSTSCAAEFTELHFNGWELPPRDHLFLAKYNMSALENVWWDHTPAIDLAARFNIKPEECPKIMFVPHITRHGSIGENLGEPVFWDSSQAVDWRQWVLRQLEVSLTIKNTHATPVHIHHSDNDTFVLGPGQSSTFTINSHQEIAAVADGQSLMVGFRCLMHACMICPDTVIWTDVAHYVHNQLQQPFVIGADGLREDEGAGALDLGRFGANALLSRDQVKCFKLIMASMLDALAQCPGYMLQAFLTHATDTVPARAFAAWLQTR